jgi:carbon-monoxide dehydrogenase medium subunit
VKLDYRMPASLDEALEILAAAGGKARVIAGGTDLMLDLQTKKYTPEHLVDVTGIGELHQVKFSE